MSLPLPYREDVNQWSVEQLAAWLQQREMPDIADIYLRKGIDGHKMITLPEVEHVTGLHTLSLRERLDLLNIIKEIKNQPVNPTHKPQLQKTSSVQNNNYRKPLSQSPAPTQVPSNNLRFVSSHLSSPEHSLHGEVEASDLSVPYIDETVNEDYLVPLSTGLGALPLDVSPQIKPKKDRCPSPLVSQSKLRERNKIQDLELPEPPSNHKTPLINPYIDPLKKFNYIMPSKDDENKHGEKIENKEDFNAYEIIREEPNESESRANVDSQEPEMKPPDLPYRNFVPQSLTPAPPVPVRTHASTNRQHSARNRFATLSSDAQQREGRKGSFPQPFPNSIRTPFSPPISTLGLRKPTNPNRPNHNHNLTKPKFSIDVGSRPSCPHHDSEVLQLEGSKSVVPLNSLYRSLLDKDYFHPVVRNVVAEMLTEDGMFLVRPSTHSQHMLTLSVSNKGKIFNIFIRSRNDSKFALGTEKRGEFGFSCVDEMIKFHNREPIKVEDGSLVYLKRSPPKDKICDCRK